MLKRYLPFGFWMTGLSMFFVRLVHHLHAGALAWRLMVDAIVVALFTATTIESRRRLKSAKQANENSMAI
jgi:hypothetical protein